MRNVEVVEPVKEAGAPALGKSKTRKSEKFYSDSEEEEEEEEEGSSSEGSSTEGSESESESEENSDDSNKSSSSQSEKSSSESDSEKKKKKTLKNKKLQQQKPESKDRKQKNGNPVKGESRSESESDSESSSSESGSESGSELGSDSDSGTDQKKNTRAKPVQSKPVSKQVEKKEVSLLDLDDFSPAAVTTPKSSILSPSLLSDLQGLSISPTASALRASSPVFVPETSHELLHRMTGKGLSAQYRFTRQPCIYGNSMVSLQLTLSNSSDQALEDIHISEKSSTGQNIHRFNAIERLEPQASVTVSMGVDFNDSTQAANFQLCTKEDEFSVSIQPAVGELLLPITMSEAGFTKEQGKLVGMNESSATITMTPENVSSQSVNRKVVSVANLGVIPSSQENMHRFAGKTMSSGSLVLVSVALNDPDAVITINTEKTVMGSMLLRQFKTALTNSGP